LKLKRENTACWNVVRCFWHRQAADIT